MTQATLPKLPQPSGKAIGVSALAAMLAIAVPLVATWEGKSRDPYRDIVGIWTVCYGETRVEMRRYSDAECTAMLDKAVAEFGQGVLKRNPALESRPYTWAAASSFAYNIGPRGYSGSTTARLFQAGRWAEGCDAMARWNKARINGRLVVKRGLVNRRKAEIAVCKTGLHTRFGFTTAIAAELSK